MNIYTNIFADISRFLPVSEGRIASLKCIKIALLSMKPNKNLHYIIYSYLCK